MENSVADETLSNFLEGLCRLLLDKSLKHKGINGQGRSPMWTPSDTVCPTVPSQYFSLWTVLFPGILWVTLALCISGSTSTLAPLKTCGLASSSTWFTSPVGSPGMIARTLLPTLSYFALPPPDLSPLSHALSVMILSKQNTHLCYVMFSKWDTKGIRAEEMMHRFRQLPYT